MFQNGRLYIELFDVIDRKQEDLWSVNPTVKKPLEKLWDEEATLKSLFSPCLILYSVLKAGILLWCTYCDLEDNARSFCIICSYVFSLFPPFLKGKTRLPCCLSESVWLSLFSLWWKKIDPILLPAVTVHMSARFSLLMTIVLIFDPFFRLLPPYLGSICLSIHLWIQLRKCSATAKPQVLYPPS